MCKEEYQKWVEEWDVSIKNYLTSNKDPQVLENDGYQQRFTEKLNVCAMPEPYFGDPEHCSIAFMNLNPGQVDCKVSEIFKSYVNSHSYSDLAKGWPYIFPNQFDLPNDAQGHTWWKLRKRWLNKHFLHDETCESLPFALELCPWHSKNFPNKNKVIKAIQEDKVINNQVKQLIDVFEYAIKQSKVGYGVCIGVIFKEVLELFGFKEIGKDDAKYKNCEHTKNSNKECGLKIIDDTKRYYNIYERNGVKVLITWAVGSNRPSANKFIAPEKEIIDRYILCK